MRNILLIMLLIGSALAVIACQADDPVVVSNNRADPNVPFVLPTSAPTRGVTSTPARAGGTSSSTPTVIATRVVKPNAPLLTTTGKVKRVEPLANQQLRLEIQPDDPAMRSEFVIADWGRITVLHYWAGLQTPTPVAEANKYALVQQMALGREVSVGYYATEPPLIVLVSVHKKPGDPQ